MKYEKMSTLTEENLRKIIEDVMMSPNPKTGKPIFTELPEGFNLDDQIKDGFSYQIKSEGLCLATGTGGIREFIKNFREAGLPAEFYVGDISVWTGHCWLPIIDAKFTPKEKDNE